MFGQGFLPCSPDFGVVCLLAPLDGVVLVVGVLVDWLVVVLSPVLVVPVDADAPAIPAAAPPVASAPATIVAPSSLDIVIRSTSFGSLIVGDQIVRRLAKHACTGA
jgi:hypothetical protein